MSPSASEENKRKRALKKLVAAISKAAQEADRLEVTLPNGGLVGNMLSEIANDIDNLTERPR